MMEKRLIVTRADERVSELTELTHPILKNYAKKCNADFMILSGNETPPMHHYRILKFYDLLDKYDRVMHLDSDIIIRDDCPNLFEVVPVDKIGSLLEDKGSRKDHRRMLIKAVQDDREDVGWTEGYINTGVFIVSKCHKEIFSNVDVNNLWMDFGQDDVELGYQIHKLGFEIYELPFQLNHMSMFSEKWHNKASRFDSYIIHYAGNGFFPFMKQAEQIRQDLALMKRLGMVTVKEEIKIIKKIKKPSVTKWSDVYEANYNGEDVVLKVNNKDKERFDREINALRSGIPGLVKLIKVIKTEEGKDAIILEKLNKLPDEISEDLMLKIMRDSLFTLRQLYLNDYDWIARIDHVMIDDAGGAKLIDFNDDEYKRIPFISNSALEGIVMKGECNKFGAYKDRYKFPYSGWYAIMNYFCKLNCIDFKPLFDRVMYDLVVKEYQSLHNVHQPIYFDLFKDVYKKETISENKGELVPANRICTDRGKLIEDKLNEYYEGDTTYKTVLDIGSNVGWFCFYLNDKLNSLTVGLDANKQLTDFSVLLTELYDKDVTCKFENNIFDLDYASNMPHFDIVLALSTLHWVIVNAPNDGQYSIGKGTKYFLDIMNTLSEKTNCMFLELPLWILGTVKNEYKNVNEYMDFMDLILDNSLFYKYEMIGQSDAKRPIIFFTKEE